MEQWGLREFVAYVILNSNKGNFSMLYFYNLTHYTMVKPLVELTNEGNLAKVKHTLGDSLSLQEACVLVSKSII